MSFICEESLIGVCCSLGTTGSAATRLATLWIRKRTVLSARDWFACKRIVFFSAYSSPSFNCFQSVVNRYLDGNVLSYVSKHSIEHLHPT